MHRWMLFVDGNPFVRLTDGSPAQLTIYRTHDRAIEDCKRRFGITPKVRNIGASDGLFGIGYETMEVYINLCD